MKNKIKKSVLFSLLLCLPALTFSQTPPPLGAAADFVFFTSIGATTAAAPLSQITGDVGSNSAGGTSGFGNINGTMHTNDASSLQAATDLSIAYTDLNNQIPGDTLGPLLGGCQVLVPNVYLIDEAASNTASLVLNGRGDSNACFVFQINGALTTAAGASIVLTNGTKACNVFWRVAGAVTIATNNCFKGTIISDGAIDIRVGCILEGRALSIAGAVTVSGLTAGKPIGCGSTILTGPPAPNLASTGNFALLTSNGTVTNTGTTNVLGDIGSNNGTASGFNQAGVVGLIHPVPDVATGQASLDLSTIYTYLNGLPTDIELLFPALFGNGQVLTPHVYIMNSAATLTDTIFFDARGDSTAVFVIRIMGALTTGTSPQVVLLGSAQANNVFWQVEGAVTISTGGNFNGIIVANNGAIILNNGVVLSGKAFSTGGNLTTGNATIVDTNFNITAQSAPAHCNCDFILPIDLLSFTASPQDAHVEVSWVTASENNNDYFNVERSVDGINFTSISTVDGAGNSTEMLTYSTVDNRPLDGTSYYRLKQTDYDGKTSYSSIEAVEFNEMNDFNFEIYPNPFSVKTTFQTSEILKDAILHIYNSYGREVKQVKNISGQTFSLARENLSSGLYLITLVQDGKIVATDKLVITN
jgi:hypothetical protein